MGSAFFRFNGMAFIRLLEVGRVDTNLGIVSRSDRGCLHMEPTLTEAERAEIAKQIEAFDKWFQYAENIGQLRLYNLLMAASIMFVGCATLLASTGDYRNIYAGGLAMLGMLVSRMWYVLEGDKRNSMICLIEILTVFVIIMEIRATNFQFGMFGK